MGNQFPGAELWTPFINLVLQTLTFSTLPATNVCVNGSIPLLSVFRIVSHSQSEWVPSQTGMGGVSHTAVMEARQPGLQTPLTRPITTRNPFIAAFSPSLIMPGIKVEEKPSFILAALERQDPQTWSEYEAQTTREAIRCRCHRQRWTLLFALLCRAMIIFSILILGRLAYLGFCETFMPPVRNRVNEMIDALSGNVSAFDFANVTSLLAIQTDGEQKSTEFHPAWTNGR